MNNKFTIFFILLASIITTNSNAETDNKCLEQGTSVLVLLEKEVLLLCKNGEQVGKYDVSIGSKGYGKREEGDKKTPIGMYPLENPRKSKSGYHKFIPIGYPTQKQIASGYTGSAIGIHGPKKGFRWLGQLSTMVNWTKGCIAVSTVKKIDEISSWVELEKVKKITLK